MDSFIADALRVRTPRFTAAEAGTALGLIGLIAATAATAEPLPARTLEQITVTADRLSATAPGEGAARVDAQRVPGGSEIVGREEYADGRASNLAEVFALSPGVFAQTRFGAEEARLSIRGSGLQRTFHSRGIYLLQDGVPITLADGSGDFQAIEPLALAYTEVLRGANALEYGGTTLGGSINFISPSGHDGGGIRPRLEGGSFGYRRAQLSAGDANGNVDYFASLSAYTQDGFRDWSEQENERFFGNVGLKVGYERRDSLLPLRGAYGLAASRLAHQGAAGEQRGAGERRAASPGARSATSTSIAWPIARSSISTSAASSCPPATATRICGIPIFQVLQQRSNDFNVGLRLVDEHSIAGHGNRFIVGVAPSWNRVNDDRFVNVAGTKGARTAASDQRSQNLTAYAENQFDIVEQFRRW